MRQHDAFGDTGGSGRIQQCSQFIASADDRRIAIVGSVGSTRERTAADLRRVSGRDYSRRRRQCCSQLPENQDRTRPRTALHPPGNTRVPWWYRPGSADGRPNHFSGRPDKDTNIPPISQPAQRPGRRFLRRPPPAHWQAARNVPRCWHIGKPLRCRQSGASCLEMTETAVQSLRTDFD